MSKRSVVVVGALGFAVLGVCMAGWSFQNGYTADDHFMRALFKGFPGLDGLERASLETFSFSKGNSAENEWLRDKGVFPWWAVSSAKLYFFRPAASLTHWLDFYLWGDRAAPMHAQNILWYALLCALVFLLLAELFGCTYVAVIAAFLYAMNETNGAAIGWISSRNTLMVACATVAVLIAHHRWRTTGQDRWAVAAVTMFGVGLLCGEGAISVCCYLFAYALFLDARAWTKRIQPLLPYVVVSVVYLALHRHYGFGSAGSAWYTDPGEDFSGWLRLLSTNIPILFFTELVVWPSPVLSVSPPHVYAYFAMMLAGTALILFLLTPTLRASPVARFLLLGAVLSLVPVSSVIAQPRVLTISSIGVMAVIAQFISHWINGRQFQRLLVIVLVLTLVIRVADAWLRLGTLLFPIAALILAALFYCCCGLARKQTIACPAAGELEYLPERYFACGYSHT
ncbi:MAG: glycosyltransferase family 39 protein [Candidatus Hydrogenedentes bacterium]|nr:glycosyltransferase family 39 protein [Candidatus Hydrogenedentota bacterium]